MEKPPACGSPSHAPTRRGEDAALKAAAKADAMQDNTAGRRVWLDILAKVKELQRHGAVGRCSTLVFSGPNVRFSPFFFCSTPAPGVDGARS